MDNLDNKEQHYAPITQNVGDGNEFAICYSKLSFLMFTLPLVGQTFPLFSCR